jgi:hypothetical protein
MCWVRRTWIRDAVGVITEGAGLRLDRSGEPWVGVFPTLGAVQVHADGSIDVDVEPGSGNDTSEESSLREAALRYGWGEPLSLVRRGFRCAWGTAMVPPEGGGGLVLNGRVHDVAIVLAELVGHGWSVLADRLVPTTWVDGDLVASPREAPVLVSRALAERTGIEATPARLHSDASRVDVPRASQPQPVRAFANVGHRRLEETTLAELVGHERFGAAFRVMADGVLSGVDDVAGGKTMQNHLALASLPFCRLRIRDDSAGADVAELVRWWRSVTGEDHGRAS